MQSLIGVRPVLGTMTFSGQTNKEGSIKQLTVFAEKAKDFGFNCELDTARMYQHGETEELLGEILGSNAQGPCCQKYIAASKINPFKGYDECLSPKDCERQCNATLKSLKSGKLNILYLHAPCRKTKLLDTLFAVKKLHDEGMYNAITRQIETELLPVCRQLGIRFYAYNPLAGGLLTGKYSLDQLKANKTPKTGRFNNPMYRERFFRPAYFSAIEMMSVVCAASGISMADAALRYLSQHSLLTAEHGDAIIIGASNFDHFTANIDSLTKQEKLPDAVVAAYDMCWKMCRGECPLYFRGFSGMDLTAVDIKKYEE
eukprot:GSMAST32.ASY1.ANO1.1001.1 assembled CDS